LQKIGKAVKQKSNGHRTENTVLISRTDTERRTRSEILNGYRTENAVQESERIPRQNAVLDSRKENAVLDSRTDTKAERRSRLQNGERCSGIQNGYQGRTPFWTPERRTPF
jgi:hypothetical protein